MEGGGDGRDRYVKTRLWAESTPGETLRENSGGGVRSRGGGEDKSNGLYPGQPGLPPRGDGAPRHVSPRPSTAWCRVQTRLGSTESHPLPHHPGPCPHSPRLLP